MSLREFCLFCTVIILGFAVVVGVALAVIDMDQPARYRVQISAGAQPTVVDVLPGQGYIRKVGPGDYRWQCYEIDKATLREIPIGRPFTNPFVGTELIRNRQISEDRAFGCVDWMADYGIDIQR